MWFLWSREFLRYIQYNYKIRDFDVLGGSKNQKILQYLCQTISFSGLFANIFLNFPFDEN